MTAKPKSNKQAIRQHLIRLQRQAEVEMRDAAMKGKLTVARIWRDKASDFDKDIRSLDQHK